MDTQRIQQTAENLERFIALVRASGRVSGYVVDKAEALLTTQISVGSGVRPITARSNGHVHSYRVRSGSKLTTTYTVDRESWTCDCPAQKCCYHVVATWILERAAS